MENLKRYQKILAAACCAIFTLALSSAAAYADDAVTAEGNDNANVPQESAQTEQAVVEEDTQTEQADVEENANQSNAQNIANTSNTQPSVNARALGESRAECAGNDIYVTETSHGYYATWNSTGKRAENVWGLNMWGHPMFFGKDGYAVRELNRIDGERYYFDSYNCVLQYGVLTWTDMTKSYFDPNKGDCYGGAMSTNRWISVKGKKYYIDDSGYTVKYLNTINGNKYYFNGYCQMQTGVIKWKSNGKISYFDPRQGGKASVNRWISWHGKKYYLDRNGYSVKYLNSIRGSKYYFNSACQMQTGVVKWKSNGKISYFDPRQGGKMATNRWISYHGTKYYLDKNGYSTKRVR